MVKINFADYQEPAIDADNLNNLQDNIEDAIGDVHDYVDTKVGNIVSLMEVL